MRRQCLAGIETRILAECHSRARFLAYGGFFGEIRLSYLQGVGVGDIIGERGVAQPDSP